MLLIHFWHKVLIWDCQSLWMLELLFTILFLWWNKVSWKNAGTLSTKYILWNILVLTDWSYGSNEPCPDPYWSSLDGQYDAFRVFPLKHNPSKHKHPWTTGGARAEWLWCQDQGGQRSSHCPQAWTKQITELPRSLLRKGRPNLTRGWKVNSLATRQLTVSL